MLQHRNIKAFLKPFSFLPAILIMCIIFSFSAQTGKESGSLSHEISVHIVSFVDQVFQKNLSKEQIEYYADSIEIPIRKLAHMTEYGVFYLSLIFPLFVYKIRGKRLILIPLILCICFAATDEYHQSFIAGRGPSIIDVIIDSIGAFIGLSFFCCMHFILQKRHKKSE